PRPRDTPRRPPRLPRGRRGGRRITAGLSPKRGRVSVVGMARKETRQQRAEVAYFISYAQDRLVFHERLVIPLAVLYRDHEEWSKDEFTKPLPKKRFMDCIEEAGCVITRNGRGTLRFAVH